MRKEYIKMLVEASAELVKASQDHIFEEFGDKFAELEAKIQSLQEQIDDLNARITADQVEKKLVNNPDIVKFISSRGAA